ncbi:MAG: hypothetical protein GYB66_02410 [Chloroflexi bacterium]|nr:hypothetical protein [Chloroflexota bacterium]
MSRELPIRGSIGGGWQLFVRLLPVIGLFWLFFFLRVHRIENVLYFVDELRHIGRARLVWTFQDIDVSTTPKKILLYYYLGLFDLPFHLPGWLARTAVAIFTLLGAAGMFALARVLFSWRVGLLSLAILSFFPFMFFYDRLALSDPVTASMIAVVAWWSVLTVRRPTAQRGIVLGILMTIMLLAKTLALPLLGLPVLGVIFLSRHRPQWDRPLLPQMLLLWRTYRRPALIAGVIVGVSWVVILGFYKLRQWTSDAPTTPIVNSYLYQSAGPVANTERIVYGMWYLWGPLLILLLVAGIVVLSRRRFRPTWYLLAAAIPYWIALVVVAGQLSTRYLTLVGHLWVIMIAAGVVELSRAAAEWAADRSAWSQRVAYLPVAVLVVWVGAFSIPFWLTLLDEPVELSLPPRDEHEYFRNQTGYGLRDAMHDVARLPPISAGIDIPVVVGQVRNCSFLGHHIPAEPPVKVECRYFTYKHRHEWPPLEVRMTHLNEMLGRYGAVYVIAEDLEGQAVIDPAMVAGDFELIKTYERPFDGFPVELYVVRSIG